MSLRAWLRGPLLGAGLCLATVSAAVKLAAAQCPLIYGETQFPDAFEPVTTLNNMPAVRVSALLFASLVRFDEFREAQPCLAESWTLLPGGRQIRFRLRPGLVWHDGQPLQASDVKFTLDLFRRTDSFIGPYYRHKAQAFLGATVLGDLEIEFEFVQPAPTEAEALSRCRFPILPEHVLRGPGLKRASSFSTQKPVGSGPYYLAEIAVAENRVTLHANPRYFARPQIEEIVMRKRANQELLTLALQGGGLDFIADI